MANLIGGAGRVVAANQPSIPEAFSDSSRSTGYALAKYALENGSVVPAGIAGAVPTIREWKHARLPRALADDDVQRVLAAVDETRPNDRRDRAILLLLSRLGLRASEAAALTVQDVDWHNGIVRVTGKGGKERRLPLPADVGAALVAALRSRPPATPPDVIFVTARPPYRQLCGSAVSDIAKRALRRAGVTVTAARRPHFPARLCVPDGPPECADEDRRRPARPCPPGDHHHLRQAGPRDPGDDRPAVARRRTMTGMAWRQYFQTYVALRRAIGFTMQREAPLLQDFVAPTLQLPVRHLHGVRSRPRLLHAALPGGRSSPVGAGCPGPTPAQSRGPSRPSRPPTRLSRPPSRDGSVFHRNGGIDQTRRP